MLDVLREQRFNALRIPVAADSVLAMDSLRPTNMHGEFNAELVGKTYGELLEAVVAEAGKRGIAVLLDMHRLRAAGGIEELWHTAQVPERDVAEAWRLLAVRFGRHRNVLGADLVNEPHGQAEWGSGGLERDWAAAAERLASVIARNAPHWLVFVEGVQARVGNWGGVVAGALSRPINHAVPNKVVYSPHVYGPDVTTRTAGEREWRQEWADVRLRGGMPVVIGEWGGRSNGRDAQWQRDIAAFMRANDLCDAFYWCFNPNSGDTGGLLLDDWKTIDAFKASLLNDVCPNPRFLQYDATGAAAPQAAASPAQAAAPQAAASPTQAAWPWQSGYPPATFDPIASDQGAAALAQQLQQHQTFGGAAQASNPFAAAPAQPARAQATQGGAALPARFDLRKGRVAATIRRWYGYELEEASAGATVAIKSPSGEDIEVLSLTGLEPVPPPSGKLAFRVSRLGALLVVSCPVDVELL